MSKEFTLKNIYDNAEKRKANAVEPNYKIASVDLTITFNVPSSKLNKKNNTEFLVKTANELINKSQEERHELAWEDGTIIFDGVEINEKVSIYKYS